MKVIEQGISVINTLHNSYPNFLFPKDSITFVLGKKKWIEIARSLWLFCHKRPIPSHYFLSSNFFV